MKKLNSIIFAFIALALFSCKDDETEPDTQAPAIAFSAPAGDAEFNEGEEISIEAEVTDNLALERVSLSVTSPDGSSQTLLTLSESSFNDPRETSVYESYTPEAGAAGNFTFTIEARDKSGNTSTESITVLVLEADRNAPAISIHSPETDDEFNPEDAIRLQAFVSDESALDEVTVWVTPEGGMQHLVHTVNPDNYSNDGSETEIDEAIRLASGTPLAGSYTLTLRAADEHGNTAEESITIHIREVDTHAPTISIANPVDGAAYYPNETIALRAEVIDNLALASVTVSLTPPGGEAQLVHTVNPDDFTNNKRKADISEAISFGTDVLAGEYLLTVTATDSHDNVAEESVSIHVRETDPNAPAITIHSPAEGIAFSTEEVVTLEAHVQDESALASVIIRLSDPAGETQTLRTLGEEDFANGSLEAHISENISLGSAAGNYKITIVATDTEGNSSDKSVSVLVRIVDTSAPTITLHDPVAGTEYTTRDAIPVSASVVDESRLEEVSVWLTSPDGDSRLAHSENRADFLNDGREAEVETSTSLASGNFAAGAYTILVRATDENGHTAEETVSVNVREADTTAPTITVNSPAAGRTFLRGEEVLIDALVEDDKELAEIHVEVTLGAMFTIQEETITEFDDPTYHRVEQSAVVPDDAPFGTYKVTITATDAEGNQAIKTLTFQVAE